MPSASGFEEYFPVCGSIMGTASNDAFTAIKDQDGTATRLTGSEEMRFPASSRTILGLMFVAAGMLTFEISLTRIFAVQQFHHFGFIVVSLAVLGISASGLILSVQRKHPRLSYLALAYAITAFTAYLMMNFIPFDSYSIAWDRRQYFFLLTYFLAAGLPFLFAGWVVGACLADAGTSSYRPYAANLFGAACGCLLAVLGINLWGVEGALALSISLGIVAAGFFSARFSRQAIALAVALFILWFGIQAPTELELRLSPYKPLSIAQLKPDAKLALTETGFAARLDVIESSSTHIFPGLGLLADGTIPDQAAVFIDGEGPLPITNLTIEDARDLPVIQRMPSSIAYQLRPGGEVLIIQADTGLNAIVALSAGASSVTVPVDEPIVSDLMLGAYASFSQGLFLRPEVKVIDRSSRSILGSGGASYDVIEYALTDSYFPVTSGAFSLTENYILTVDSFKEAFQRLSNDGLLVVTRWLGTPPSETARAWSTLIAALRESGLESPEDHLISFRGMRTGTMIASRSPFTDQELKRVREFLHENRFDPVFMPDLEPEEINRSNILPDPVYARIFDQLLFNPEPTIANHLYNLTPPRDDRPYFHHFFRWKQLPTIVDTLGLTWQPFGGSGYLILFLLLGLMVLLASLLIIFPYTVSRRRKDTSSPNLATLVYFGCLGAGYLFVEIFLIQRLTLFLDQPAIALALVLFSLLMASGLGSLLSPRVSLDRAIAGVILVLLLSALAVPWVIQSTLHLSFLARIGISILVIIPTGILMGIPFPSGMKRLETILPGMIPWAWAVNGALSGVSGVLAALVALDLGFTPVLSVGVLVYFGALLTSGRIGASRSRTQHSQLDQKR